MQKILNIPGIHKQNVSTEGLNRCVTMHILYTSWDDRLIQGMFAPSSTMCSTYGMRVKQTQLLNIHLLLVAVIQLCKVMYLKYMYVYFHMLQKSQI